MKRNTGKAIYEECKRLAQELEELRAAYTVLIDLVQSYQMTKDVDIDWKKFPKETLCAAHQEIKDLRKRLLNYELAPTIYDNNPEMKAKVEKIVKYFGK